MLSLPVFIGGIKLKESINNKKKSKLGMRRTGFIIAFLAPTILAFCVFLPLSNHYGICDIFL